MVEIPCVWERVCNRRYAAARAQVFARSLAVLLDRIFWERPFGYAAVLVDRSRLASSKTDRGWARSSFTAGDIRGFLQCRLTGYQPAVNGRKINAASAGLDARMCRSAGIPL